MEFELLVEPIRAFLRQIGDFLPRLALAGLVLVIWLLRTVVPQLAH